MSTLQRVLAITFTGILAIPALACAAGRIHVVAAENFYGNIASQIGGPRVSVTSILNNPDTDPHLFEVSPAVARAVSGARIVIYNGIDYDPWMSNLLAATSGTHRRTIDVAALAGHHAGDNPHIWYDTDAMLVYADKLAQTLASIDPAHRAYYEHRLARFQQSMQPLRARIVMMRKALAGIPVTATEPIFGYMLAALGMKVRDRAFQLAIMNGTEPGAAAIAELENDLKAHRVRLLIYNGQVFDPTTNRIRQLAEASHIPVVAVTETEPAGIQYQDWMMNELSAVAQALRGGHP